MAYEIILITGNTQTLHKPSMVINTGTTVISGITYITGNTQPVMGTIIEVRTFSGLTAIDGDLLTFGVLKFDTKFLAGSTDAQINPKFYRDRAKPNNGYSHRDVLDYPREFIMKFTEEEYYSITPMLIFEKVCDWLNNYMGVVAFEINEY